MVAGRAGVGRRGGGKSFPPALILRLDASFASLLAMLKRATLGSETELSAFVETVNALDLVLQQTEEGLKELAVGLPQADGGGRTEVKDVIKPYRITQRAVDFVERSEQAFLNQFIKAPVPAARGGAQEAEDAGAPPYAAGPRKAPAQSHTAGLLASVLEGVTHACGAERAALFLADSQTPLAMCTRVECTMPSLARISFKSGIAHAVHLGNIGLNAFCKAPDRQCMRELRAASVLCLPLRAPCFASKSHAEQVTGVLLLINKCGGARGFADHDEGMASAACHLIHYFVNKHEREADVASLAAHPEVVVMDPLLQGSAAVLGALPKAGAGKGADGATALHKQRASAAQKRAQANLESLSAQLDAPENRKPLQHVVKRVWDDETAALPLPENGCLDVELGKMVKDATSEARWVSYGWKSRATQVAEAMNTHDSLKGEVAVLQQLLIEANIRPVQPLADYERELALLQQVRDGIKQKARVDASVKKNLEKLEVENTRRESFLAEGNQAAAHEGRRRYRSSRGGSMRKSFSATPGSPTYRDRGDRAIPAVSLPDAPEAALSALADAVPRSPRDRTDSLASTFCGAETRSVRSRSHAFPSASRHASNSSLNAPRAASAHPRPSTNDPAPPPAHPTIDAPDGPAITLSSPVEAGARPSVASLHDAAPSPRGSVASVSLAVPDAPLPRGTAAPGKPEQRLVLQIPPTGATGAASPVRAKGAGKEDEATTPQHGHLLNRRLEARIEEAEAQATQDLRYTRPEVVLGRLADRLEKVAEMGPPRVGAPAADGSPSTPRSDEISSESDGDTLSIPRQRVYARGFGDGDGPAKRPVRPGTARDAGQKPRPPAQWRSRTLPAKARPPRTAAAAAAPPALTPTPAGGVLSVNASELDPVEGWDVTPEQPGRDTIPAPPPSSVLDTSWKKPRPPGRHVPPTPPARASSPARSPPAAPLPPPVPPAVAPGPPTLPVTKVDLSGKFATSVNKAAKKTHTARTIRGRSPMGVL